MKICVDGAAWFDHFNGLHCGNGSVVDTGPILILKQDDRVTHAADSFLHPIAINTWLALNRTSRNNTSCDLLICHLCGHLTCTTVYQTVTKNQKSSKQSVSIIIVNHEHKPTLNLQSVNPTGAAAETQSEEACQACESAVTVFNALYWCITL